MRLTLQVLQHALTIPAVAVNQGPKGSFVYLVGPDRKAIVRPVTVQATEQGSAVISSGLGAGDVVVTDGQMSLAPGSKVQVHGEAPAGGRRAR